MTNEEILQNRTETYNNRPGARVGDFLKLPTGKFTRFTYSWDDHIQTGGMGGSYYLGNGYLSYSGGLDPGVKKSDIVETDEKKDGLVWIFDKDEHRAHNAVHFKIEQRVFALKENADISGIWELKYGK